MGNPEGQFDTKLHEAVRYSDLEDVKVALQQGYDPNLIGLYQWNALHEASHNGEREILQLLLEKKGDPNKSDYLQSRTAMHYAAEQGHIECLKLLVRAGGRCDIKDTNGKTSLDLATPGGRKILEKLRVRDIMLGTQDDADTVVSDEGIVTDRSHDQMSLTSSRRSSIESQQDKGPALGYLHMSVEYHSKKSTMKIRVWQLSDLLLPPPNTSMIHSIYVKSYLQPDKKKESKRKTEEVKVDTSEGHIHWRRKKEVSVQHVFTPATFKFSRPLEYSGITADHVKDKNLEIEVCITQRYSHRSFLIGMVRMSLKSAVKKLVKEKLPLIPCMNHTIPSSMKVYCASDLNVMNNTPGGNIFFSNPNVRVVLPEDSDDVSEKAASNPDLQEGNQSLRSSHIDMEGTFTSMTDVPKLDLSNLALNESGYSSEVHVTVPCEMGSPDSKVLNSSQLRNVKSPDISSRDTSSTVAGPSLDSIESHKIVTPANKPLDLVVEISDLDTDKLESVAVIEPVNRSDNNVCDLADETVMDRLSGVTVESRNDLETKKHGKKHKDRKTDKPTTSKGDKLTWDYSDIPDVVSRDIGMVGVPWKEGEAPVLLPMETRMGIQGSQKTKMVKNEERQKAHRRSKTKYSQPVPGTAVLLPQIVVTQPPETKTVPETVIIVPEQTQSVLETEKENDTKLSNVQEEQNVSDKQIKTGLKKLDRKSFINVGKAFGKKNKENVSENIEKTVDKQGKSGKVKPRLKLISKNKDNNSAVKGIHFDKDVSNISDRVLEEDSEFVGVKVDKTVKNDAKSGLRVEDSNRPVSVSRTSSGSSVVVDMEQLSRQTSSAHVIEVLDDDISITELDDNDLLFTDRSEAPSLVGGTLSDMESGLSDYRLPECKSPTQYMIPVQVYDVDDTSCDESMSFDEPDLPTTEL